MLELPSSQVTHPTWDKEIKYWKSLLISKLNSFNVTVDLNLERWQVSNDHRTIIRVMIIRKLSCISKKNFVEQLIIAKDNNLCTGMSKQCLYKLWMWAAMLTHETVQSLVADAVNHHEPLLAEGCLNISDEVTCDTSSGLKITTALVLFLNDIGLWQKCYMLCEAAWRRNTSHLYRSFQTELYDSLLRNSFTIYRNF